MEIVTSIDECKSKRFGWVYFLLSKDSKYLKIGKATCISSRLTAISKDDNYKDYKFRLLAAVPDGRLEGYFHDLFYYYRARLVWNYNGIEYKALTKQQVWNLAKKQSKSLIGHYCFDHIESLAYSTKHLRVSGLELFKIPPRKLTPCLVDIINGEIEHIKKCGSGCQTSRRLVNGIVVDDKDGCPDPMYLIRYNGEKKIIN